MQLLWKSKKYFYSMIVGKNRNNRNGNIEKICTLWEDLIWRVSFEGKFFGYIEIDFEVLTENLKEFRIRGEFCDLFCSL